MTDKELQAECLKILTRFILDDLISDEECINEIIALIDKNQTPTRSTGESLEASPKARAVIARECRGRFGGSD